MQPAIEGLNAALVSVFLAAWFVGVAIWFYGIGEMLAATGFARFVFATGLKAVEFHETVVAGAAPLVPGSVGETEHAEFKAVDEGLYLFREKFRLVELKIHPPFPLNGTIRLRDGTAHVVGRLPIGTFLFLAAWAVGWTAAGLSMLLLQGDPLGLPFLLFGWGLVCAMAVFSLRVEKPRFQRAYEEVRAELGWITPVSRPG